MKTTDARSRKSLVSFGVAALLALGAASAQVASIAGTSLPGTAGIDNTGSYQSEVQSCLSGKTQQAQADCLREARNAHADKARGVLDNGNNLQANSMARCDVFTGAEDKAACQARLMGYGEVDGSVAGGGLIREVETVVPPAGASTFTVNPQTDSGPVVLTPSTSLSK
jgi:hypothetical protein